MTFHEEDRILCRTYISEIGQREGEYIPIDKKDLWWIHIKGITDYYKKSDIDIYNNVFKEILSGCMMTSCCVAYLIKGTQEGIQIYAGITDDEELYSSYIKNYEASFPGIDLKEKAEITLPNYKYGGFVVGIPEVCGKNSKENNHQNYGCDNTIMPIDRLCRGMLGSNFTFMVLAERQPELFVQKAIEKVENVLAENSKSLNSNRMGEGGWQIFSNNISAQNYQNNLELQRDILNVGLTHGMWNVCTYYMCEEEADLYRLKSLIAACFTKRIASKFERIVCIDVEGGALANGNIGMLCKEDPYKEKHILYQLMENSGFEYYRYIYQTMMNSENLANYFWLPRNEIEGFYIDDFVNFEMVPRQNYENDSIRIGHIIRSGRSRVKPISNIYKIPVQDLNRHALIVGITGGGKTNTMKVLLSEIWRKNAVPFLVIESAKREYIELRQIMKQSGTNNFDTLDVFTLGDEGVNSVKYRINPFQAAEGVSLQSHIDYLLSTFNASFEMYAPMPYILEQAVYEVYEDKGWDLISNRNIRGMKEYPTLSQLYYKIDVVTDRLGYDTEIQSNVKAALKARINSLRIGGKGALLDVARSIPIDELLQNPTVLELEDIGDDNIKAFVIGILLVQLYEYRKSQGASPELQGILVIEEAHRLLKKVPDGEEGGRAKAVEFFCNMLAEIRSYGQGIIVADQIPTKLAPDIIKNTNLKIVHRTVMEDDRQCVGAAMHMTEEQKDYLSSLRRGCAAVFAEGDNRPKLVEMPLVRTVQGAPREAQLAQIRQRIEYKFAKYYTITKGKHLGSIYCEEEGRVPENIQSAAENFSVEKLQEMIQTQKDYRLVLAGMIKFFEQECIEMRLNKQQKIFIAGIFLEKIFAKKEKQAEVLTEYMKMLYPI